MGGKSAPAPAGPSTTTNLSNTDNRMALQDAVGLNHSSIGGAVNYNSTDAVVAVTEYGRDLGGAVLELAAHGIDRNLDTVDNTVNKSVKLVDGLIARSFEQQKQVNDLAERNTKLGFGLAEVAMQSYQPGENKALDSIKAMGIAAAVAAAAAVIFRGKK